MIGVMKILVTGIAGFIGSHLAKRLMREGHEVFGLDNLNDYYDVRLKYDRLKELGFIEEEYPFAHKIVSKKGISFIRLNLEDSQDIHDLCTYEKFDAIVHLAAQAGVRYSISHPMAYANSNISGTLSILEACRHSGTKNLIFASSSSVYGLNRKQPFKETDSAEHPISLYAASKKSCEAMAHSYSHLYGINTTGLRFFTVYGPWGRPDMSPMLFAKAISDGQNISVFNKGDMARDFTYVDDVVESIYRILTQKPASKKEWDAQDPNPSYSSAPYRIYNIGNGSPIALMDFISLIEKGIGKKADLDLKPMQPGDVKSTWADTTLLEKDYGYKPQVSIEEGIGNFLEWYSQYSPLRKS